MEFANHVGLSFATYIKIVDQSKTRSLSSMKISSV